MARRKRKMFDASGEREESDGEEFVSRSKKRAARKDQQARLEALAVRLAKLSPAKRAPLELDEVTERELGVLQGMKAGSALARQRKRVAGLMRHLDLDDLEKRVERLNERR